MQNQEQFRGSFERRGRCNLQTQVAPWAPGSAGAARTALLSWFNRQVRI